MIIANTDDISQFNTFAVPNALVDGYLADANPIHIAVYLYGIRQLAGGDPNVTNAQIACALNLSEIDVVNAFLYFASKGLVKIPNFTGMENADFNVEYVFQTASPKKGAAQRPSYKSSDIARHLNDNPKMAQMYHVVRDLLGKNLSSADTNILYSFYDWYGLPVEVIIVLVEHCVSKGKRGMRTIEREAGKWADIGIDSVEKATTYIKKKEEFLTFAYRVQSALGLNSRKLTARELEFINNWHSKLQMDIPMITIAYESTINQIGKLSFAYMNKILESWREQGIRTPAETAEKDKKRTVPPRKAAVKPGEYDYTGLEQRLMEQRVLHKEDGRRGI